MAARPRTLNRNETLVPSESLFTDFLLTKAQNLKR